MDRNTEIINSLISKGFRVILASDLHFDAENPNTKIAGIRSRDRMQMFVDAVNAENRIKNVDALIFLGDFELGMAKNQQLILPNIMHHSWKCHSMHSQEITTFIQMRNGKIYGGGIERTRLT